MAKKMRGKTLEKHKCSSRPTVGGSECSMSTLKKDDKQNKNSLKHTDTCQSHNGDTRHYAKPDTKQPKRTETPMVTDQHSTGARLFPRNFHWLVFIVTLILRLCYVSMPTNWWILHPDELYQTIEVAHSETFGYGFRPYEYFSPPEDAASRSTYGARAQEIKYGMYSLRSFLLVKGISLVMATAEFCGTTMSPFLVTKLFHAIITSALPLAVFNFATSLSDSSDIGHLAAIFVSSSLTLSVLGTHTLINSFLSSFLFYSLATYVRIVRSNNCLSENNFNQTIIKSKNTVSENVNMRCQNNKSSSKYVSMLENVCDSVCKILKLNVNADIVWKWNASITKCYSLKYNKLLPNITPQLETNEPVRLDKLIKNPIDSAKHLEGTNKGTEYAHSKEINNIKGHLKTNNGMVKWTTAIYLSCMFNYLRSKLADFIAGLTLAVCVYIRLDTTLLVVLLTSVLYKPIINNARSIIRNIQMYVLGFVTGILIGGYVDAIMYRKWFLSPVQWCKFNVFNNNAGAIFGSSSADFYVDKLFDCEPFMLLITIILLADVISSWIRQPQCPSNKSPLSIGSNYSLFIFTVLLFIYSFNDHKEMRFMHNCIVVMYVALATALIRIYGFILRLFSNQNDRQFCNYYVYFFISIFVTNNIYYFVQTRDQELSKWTYGRNIDSNEVNTGLEFLRQQNDVTGVFVDMPLYMTGFYSILHKDVPVLSLNIYEFMEYDRQIRSIELSEPISYLHQVTELGQISDFISIYNSRYLLKYIIKKKKYNYLVFKIDQTFIDIGYDEVFRVGKTKILKRSFHGENEARLAEIEKSIPIGTNVSVLEHEGALLKHYGLYMKAEQRLFAANKLDPSRLGPLQILLEMYKILGRDEYYEELLNICLRIHSRRKCHSQFENSSLDKMYHDLTKQ